MHRCFSLLLLPILIGPTMVGSTLLVAGLAGQALADEPAKTEAPAKAEPQHARQTWEQRFGQANVAHDGHLTREEATAGFPLVAKHFDDIDVDHKGYVTENDVRAWRVMRKAVRRLAHPPADKLKPQHAFQRQLQDQRPVSTERRTAVGTDARVVA